jgi:hypothetical protein
MPGHSGYEDIATLDSTSGKDIGERMRWITRDHVKVGRMGCAWLIRRFIDPDAEFLFATGKAVLADAERLDAIAYHVPASDSERQGDKSSFEVMLERYHLADDPALVLLGKIVGTADVHASPWQRPEGPGLKAATDGILALYPDDPARLAAAAALYDAFYAYCQQVVSRGQPAD